MPIQRPTTSPRRARLIVLPTLATLGVLLGIWGVARILRGPGTDTLPTPTAPILGELENTLLTSPLPDDIRIQPNQGGQDRDQDGLPDSIEVFYKTDASRADTDGDGYLDGSEVANGYDPTIKSPNDKLAANPSPTPSAGPAANTPPSPPTYTQQFFTRAGLPASRSSLEANPEQVEKFVDDINARGYLPAVPKEYIKTTTASGKAAIVKYLDSISIPQNPRLHPVTSNEITGAFQTLTATKDAKPLQAILTKLDENIVALRAVVVPTEARAIHETYLAATIGLKENTALLLKYQQDYVGTLVAGARIEGLRFSFEEVAAGIKELERKYNIT